MSNVLRVISKQLVFNEMTSEVLMNGGKDLIPGKKLPTGIYIEDTPENRQLVESQSWSYLPGVVEVVEESEVFFRSDLTTRCMQMFLHTNDDIGIKLKASRPTKGKVSTEAYLSTIYQLVESIRLLNYHSIFAHASYVEDTKSYIIELFKPLSGEPREVLTLNRTKGIVELPIVYEVSEGAYLVKLGEKFSKLK